MSKHTPGPWYMQGLEVFVDSSDRRLLVGSVPEEEGVLAANRIADARLISAAPELLEALKISTLYMANTAGGQCRNTGLYGPLGTSPGECTCVRCEAKRKLDAVRAVIAKAEGKS